MAIANVVVAGTVLRVLDEQRITDTFKKRIIVVQADEDTEYPQEVGVEFLNDKCQYLSKFSKGDYVTIDCNVRGKDFEKDGKISNFTKLNGWRIKGTATGGASSAEDMPGAAPQPQAEPAAQQTDDLPF
jgi:single-strand DNA-binding protein